MGLYCSSINVIVINDTYFISDCGSLEDDFTDTVDEMENADSNVVIIEGCPRRRHEKKRSKSQELGDTCRRKGIAYSGQVTTKDGQVVRVMKSARKMGPPCESRLCASSRLRFCVGITDEQRQALFDDFWTNLDWYEKQEYVVKMVERVECKQTKSKASRRNVTLKYHFVIDGEQLQVCKKMFLCTLGIKESTVHYWLNHFPCGSYQKEEFVEDEEESSNDSHIAKTPLNQSPFGNETKF